MSLGTLLGGFVVGFVVLGAVSRAAMRFLAVASGTEGGFSPRGTFEVMLLGGLIGLASAPAYVLLRRFLPACSVLRGLLFGGAVYLVTIVLLPERIRSLTMSFGDLVPALVLAFGIAFLCHGLVLSIVLDRLRARAL